MQVSDVQDRLQLMSVSPVPTLSEKRKWQSEMENKKRQLEDDRRALQHLKSKALRERWLLDGAPSAGPQQDQDEARTRNLEETINRLENELFHLESGDMCQTTTHITVSSGAVQVEEVKGQSSSNDAASSRALAEVPVHKSLQKNKPKEAEQVKRAMYSVEITVERDRVTGETRILSTNTTLPVDLSHQGVVVYEDEQKVVHEVNTEDGVQPLSSSEVEELIHKADEASMMSQTEPVVTSLSTLEVQEEKGLQQVPSVTLEITGLEAKAGVEQNTAEASTKTPITMVFMGYQNVEDEDETKKVLGLQGTVKAELVLIDDDDAKTFLGDEKEETNLHPPEFTTAGASNGETAAEREELRRGALEVKKKQPCKCCSIM